MRVRLRVFGALERYLGGARLEVELAEGATLRDLYDLIDAQWGGELPARFWDGERKCFHGPVLIMSQGADVHDENMALSDRQEVMLLVPLSAG